MSKFKPFLITFVIALAAIWVSNNVGPVRNVVGPK
jgi:hypothetical protein